MKLDASTRLVGLIGYPVEHSRSPLLHNTAFLAQGLNYRYVALSVAPVDVPAALAGLKALGFLGANVTIPHKQTVLPFVDVLSPPAAAVGAVNTLVCRRTNPGRTVLYGDNTDIPGFLAPLKGAEGLLNGVEMLIFGAGGAARAVTYALLSTFQPARLTLAARRPEIAECLATDLAPYDARQALQVVPWTGAGNAVRHSTLVVNATSVGMHPHIDATPWPHPADFSESQLVYDLVYTPETTCLLRDAAERGARTIGGLEMLIRQAAASYVQWTGLEMPVEAVRKALRPVS